MHEEDNRVPRYVSFFHSAMSVLATKLRGKLEAMISGLGTDANPNRGAFPFGSSLEAQEQAQEYFDWTKTGGQISCLLVRMMETDKGLRKRKEKRRRRRRRGSG
jgi:hypothetical protein